jgi:hypothetical protein
MPLVRLTGRLAQVTLELHLTNSSCKPQVSGFLVFIGTIDTSRVLNVQAGTPEWIHGRALQSGQSKSLGQLSKQTIEDDWADLLCWQD